MDAAVAALSLVPGLAVGSFLNVVAARLPERRSIVRPGSSCGSCGTLVRWYDNVPVLSYLWLRGRCRSCGVRFGLLYPAVELATALLVGASFLAFGASLEALIAAFFCVVLVAVSATDLRARIIPNVIVLPATAIVLVAQTLRDPSPEWALASLGASGFLFLAVLAYPSGMGMGDIKLALLMGAALGTQVSVALMLGLVAALVPSAILMARYGSAARKMAIPLGPFLALGSVVALFAGDRLLDAYLSLF
jgi:prepilin signal peptidase PulO-like enzyme (type II secretory pathway)